MGFSTRFIVSVIAGCLVLTALLHDRPRNPPADPEQSIERTLKVPARVQDMLRRACYDCHSSETRWPWYSTVPALSARIEGDVTRGRSAMNFSEWTVSAGASPTRAAVILRAACAAVRGGIMPKSPYTYMHPEARLSKADVDSFCEWTGAEAAELAATVRTYSPAVER